MNLWQRTVCIVAVFLMAATAASAQNLLVNPGFDAGPAGGYSVPTGWGQFGNAWCEGSWFPFVPISPSNVTNMYGNFWCIGCFNVSGIFQEFPSLPGDVWEMQSNAYYSSSDPMTGSQAAGGNWVVQKIAFFDAGGIEIGGVESIILDGSFAPDTWHASGLITGTAPALTAKVQALVLYLQPSMDGGAAHIDDVRFGASGTVPVESSTWGQIKSLYE